MSETTNQNVNPQDVALPELRTVVVYDGKDIEAILRTIDRHVSVSGIETMRVLVNIFDVLKTKGHVQQAAVNTTSENAGFIDPSFVNKVVSTSNVETK